MRYFAIPVRSGQADDVDPRALPAQVRREALLLTPLALPGTDEAPGAVALALEGPPGGSIEVEVWSVGEAQGEPFGPEPARTYYLARAAVTVTTGALTLDRAILGECYYRVRNTAVAGLSILKVGFLGVQAGPPGNAGAVGAIGATGLAGVSPVQTWEEVLSLGNESGAFSPIVSLGQFLGIGDVSGLPPAGDIRASGGLFLSTVGLLRLGDGGITDSIQFECLNDLTGSTANGNITFTSAGQVTFSATTAVVLQGALVVANPYVLMPGQAALGLVFGGHGAYGVNDLTPTEPVFKDDGGNTLRLAYSGSARQSYAAGGSATVAFAGLPGFDFRIVGVSVITSTGALLGTVQLKTGGGANLSSAIGAALGGTQYNNDTTSRVVTAGTAVNVVRSSNAIVGETILFWQRV